VYAIFRVVPNTVVDFNIRPNKDNLSYFSAEYGWKTNTVGDTSLHKLHKTLLSHTVKNFHITFSVVMLSEFYYHRLVRLTKHAVLLTVSQL